MRKMLLCLLLAGCSQSNDPITADTYAYRYHVFYYSADNRVSANLETVTNGRFYNLSDREYPVTPRLRQFKDGKQVAYFDGSLGYTLTDDWSNYSSDDDRRQRLTDIRPTVRAYETLRIKIFTGVIPDINRYTFDLVFLINGLEQIKQSTVNW